VNVIRDSTMAVTADLAIAAYFFAMRSCEFTATPSPGRTKIIRLSGVVFRDAAHRVIPHSNHTALKTADRVTITFEDQKNGLRMDKRTHHRTTDSVLCPVWRIASLVSRMYRLVPSLSGTRLLYQYCSSHGTYVRYHEQAITAAHPLYMHHHGRTGNVRVHSRRYWNPLPTFRGSYVTIPHKPFGPQDHDSWQVVLGRVPPLH
jgi:hypothetical protein